MVGRRATYLTRLVGGWSGELSVILLVAVLVLLFEGVS